MFNDVGDPILGIFTATESGLSGNRPLLRLMYFEADCSGQAYGDIDFATVDSLGFPSTVPRVAIYASSEAYYFLSYSPLNLTGFWERTAILDCVPGDRTRLGYPLGLLDPNLNGTFPPPLSLVIE